jgi:Secretion system C-terminal sorting domain
MKKISTSILACLALVISVQAQSSFSDDFESYTVGSFVGATSPKWRTWSGQVAAQDVAVVSTKNHTIGGSKSIYLSSTTAGGGPQDLVLPFDSNFTATPMTSGIFTYSMQMFVASNKSAYFNFQGNSAIGGLYTLHFYFDSDTVFRVFTTLPGNVPSYRVGSYYSPNVWFEVKVVANLSLNQWGVYLNNVIQDSIFSLPVANNKLSYLDIYPADITDQFWVDDVQYSRAPYIPSNADRTNNKLSLQASIFPNPAQNNSLMYLNLDKKSNVELHISQMNGGVLFSKDYGPLSGDVKLPIDVSQYNSGMYFVDVKIDGKSNVLKLMKE